MEIFLLEMLFDLDNYFLEDCHMNTPPSAITAMPISGDHEKWWGLFAVISTLPRSTTFSLVKKVTAVKQINTIPRMRRMMPNFFIPWILSEFNCFAIIWCNIWSFEKMLITFISRCGVKVLILDSENVRWIIEWIKCLPFSFFHFYSIETLACIWSECTVFLYFSTVSRAIR